MKNERCANANDCYSKLTKELTKDGSEAITKKLEKYEQLKDKRVLENTTLRTRHTFVGLGTEKKEDYKKLLREGHKNIVLLIAIVYKIQRQFWAHRAYTKCKEQNQKPLCLLHQTTKMKI